MATYKFEQFNVEIVNPTVEVVNVADAINAKTCSVDVVLTTDTATFGVNLQGFFNEATHENWQGFHQWDISLDDYGCMVISLSGSSKYITTK